MNPKERFLKACRREPVDRPPVWMMRQAGRYLPEYQEVKKQKTTLQMMKNPETACEITLQPVRRLGVDAAILYSDILMVPEAMGLSLDFVKDVGPVFGKEVRTKKDVESLLIDKIASRCDFVRQTIALIRNQIPKDYPLLGFAGAPFTVGTYMAGGDGSHEGVFLKKMACEDEKTFQLLMQKLVEATIDYLTMQVKAGVDAIQLFDTWAGTLSSQEYLQWALPYTREILEAIHRLGVPTILYIKGGGPLFEKMIESKADVISIDWNLDLAEAKKKAAGRVSIQGNFDPEGLKESESQIEKNVKIMIEKWGRDPGYIINLGHGITPEIPVSHAQAFVDAAKKWGRIS